MPFDGRRQFREDVAAEQWKLNQFFRSLHLRSSLITGRNDVTPRRRDAGPRFFRDALGSKHILVLLLRRGYGEEP
jgi:hypothetical protein